jgi:probable phosphoglycerate mutase
MTVSTGSPTQVAPTLGFDAIVDLSRRVDFRPRAHRILFLRHGETEGNRKGVYQSPETPLNAAGEAQAEAAAERLKTLSLVHVAASPMMRAWRTAAVVTDGRGLTPEPDGGLQERLYLGMAGEPIGRMDWRDEFPACESLPTFVGRAGDALARWAALPDHPDGDRLIVSHGGVLLVLAALTGVDLAADLRRNATPILFLRSTAGWEAHGVG